MSGLSYRSVVGADALAALGALDELARLRIAVFRAWPYLYDGDLEHERAYLAAFAAAPHALLVLARAEGRIVGASTAMPLGAAEPAIRAPFEVVSQDIAAICYFGESVLEPAWRGRGAGHAFFDAREAHARDLGAREATFCAVVRPAHHPGRDRGYRPLDPFWRARGYAPAPGIVCRLSWRDLGEGEETDKALQFWRRRL
jgi:GNAT superfamily N-acetyltransferase